MNELKKSELRKIEGGVSIIRIEGVLDGVKGNTRVYIFGKRII